jgi:hypothetical protein
MSQTPVKKNNKKMPKGCLMVMADPSDLGHGKKVYKKLHTGDK